MIKYIPLYGVRSFNFYITIYLSIFAIFSRWHYFPLIAFPFHLKRTKSYNFTCFYQLWSPKILSMNHISTISTLQWSVTNRDGFWYKIGEVTTNTVTNWCHGSCSVRSVSLDFFFLNKLGPNTFTSATYHKTFTYRSHVVHFCHLLSLNTLTLGLTHIHTSSHSDWTQSTVFNIFIRISEYLALLAIWVSVYSSLPDS